MNSTLYLDHGPEGDGYYTFERALEMGNLIARLVGDSEMSLANFDADNYNRRNLTARSQNRRNQAFVPVRNLTPANFVDAMRGSGMDLSRVLVGEIYGNPELAARTAFDCGGLLVYDLEQGVVVDSIDYIGQTILPKREREDMIATFKREVGKDISWGQWELVDCPF